MFPHGGLLSIYLPGRASFSATLAASGSKMANAVSAASVWGGLIPRAFTESNAIINSRRTGIRARQVKQACTFRFGQ